MAKYGIKVQKRFVTWIAGGIIGIFFIIIIGFSSIWFSHFVTTTINRDTIHPSVTKANFTGIIINSNSSSKTAFSHRMHFQFKPKGDEYFKGTAIDPILTQEIYFTIDTQVIHFASNQMMTSYDLDLPIQSGNPNSYPFDKYISTFYMYAQSLNNVKIPLSLSVLAK